MTSSLAQKLRTRAFSTEEAVNQGVSKASLTRMVEQGVLDRLTRGVYLVSEINDGSSEDLYAAATLRCGKPSAICLLSALVHYGVTDQIEKQTWIMVPNEKRVRSEQLRLIRSRNPQWDTGIRRHRHYWITTLERTLVDCLIQKRLVGTQVAIAAIKQALVQNKASLSGVYDMAKKLEVAHRIQPYIEVLAS